MQFHLKSYVSDIAYTNSSGILNAFKLNCPCVSPIGIQEDLGLDLDTFSFNCGNERSSIRGDYSK